MPVWVSKLYYQECKHEYPIRLDISYGIGECMNFLIILILLCLGGHYVPAELSRTFFFKFSLDIWSDSFWLFAFKYKLAYSKDFRLLSHLKKICRRIHFHSPIQNLILARMEKIAFFLDFSSGSKHYLFSKIVSSKQILVTHIYQLVP